MIGLGFGLAVQVFAAPLFRLMGASGGVLASATLFARVLFGGAAITFLGGMFDSVMRGEGNVRVPAVWSTTSLVLQMACTPLFMFRFGWGLVGAALAMLACQGVATVPRAFWVLGGRGLVRPVFRLPRFTLAPVREILRVGVPAALSTSVSNVGLMALTAVVTRLGAADLAAYGLGTRLDFLLMSFGYGLSAAVLTLVGMATGANRPDRVQAFVTRAAAWHRERMDRVAVINDKQVDPVLPSFSQLPHINGENIESGTCRLLPYRTAAEDGVRSNKYFFSSGTVLYSKIRPYLRKAAFVDFDGLCSADMYPIRVIHPEIDPHFLKWALVALLACNVGPHGFTPLIDAARTGDVASVRHLIAQGADPNEAAGQNNWTPLLHAIREASEQSND